MFGKSFFKLPHEKIVLELGVDAPDDMRKLLKIIQPNVGVFLNVAPVHLINFKNTKEIATEKSLLISTLPKSATAILNADDQYACKIQTQAKKIFFGCSRNADLRATNVKENL
ncbi:MAG: hypothetical protein HN952_04015, partial [Candidatus Cloacimonetes bacterium]|nr:hypothetical protein [Candidatus Cloacimonadota bacterium]